MLLSELIVTPKGSYMGGSILSKIAGIGLDVMYNESTPSLTHKEYQLKYPEFLGMSPSETQAHWNSKYQDQFNAEWNESVRVEKALLAQQKLDNFETYFGGAFISGGGGSSRAFGPSIKPRPSSLGLKTVPIKTVHVNSVIRNPSVLKGKSLETVKKSLRGTSGWQEGTLNKGRSAGKGWTLSEMNSKGTDFTGRYIQWSPGSPRHFGGKPYWKVSSGTGGTQWFPAY